MNHFTQDLRRELEVSSEKIAVKTREVEDAKQSNIELVSPHRARESYHCKWFLISL